MQLGYTILYVADVASSLTFFERAFGFKSLQKNQLKG
jgi:catechol 2,3-dioxygenase-like lactoylglutathione lyase family enzyme